MRERERESTREMLKLGRNLTTERRVKKKRKALNVPFHPSDGANRPRVVTGPKLFGRIKLYKKGRE
jgi:hypothetical protein